MDAERNSTIVVHFHDQVETNANILLSNEQLFVLRTANHANSVAIEFNVDPLDFSIALCVAPKTKSDFHKVEGFIPRPSCEANNMAGNVQANTNHYFNFVCQHRRTEMLKSAPVFNANNQVNGFVIQDCSLPPLPGDKPGDRFIDSEAKICVKPVLIETWLQQRIGDNNWRAVLDDLVLEDLNV